jgi:hypothetical protein
MAGPCPASDFVDGFGKSNFIVKNSENSSKTIFLIEINLNQKNKHGEKFEIPYYVG